MDFYTLTFDASMPKNPGNRAAYGFTIFNWAEHIYSGSGAILGDKLDNNISEFYSVFKGLQYLDHIIPGPASVNIKGDSALVLNFLKKKWKMHKRKPFYEIYSKIEEILKRLHKRKVSILYTWIPRDQNEECHNLAKKVLEKT